MEDLLTSWGFSEFIDIFKENEIDVETMLAMEEHHIMEIVPKLGQRIKIFKKIKEYQRAMTVVEVPAVPSPFTSSSSTTTELANDDIEIVFQDELFKSCDKDEMEEPEMISAAFKVATKRKCAFSGEENYKRACREVYNLDLQSFIESTVTGRFILSKYHEQNQLTRQMRNQLCYLIISGLLSESNSLTPLDFDILTDKICNLFPTESASTYYIPRVRGNKMHKPINPKGKLIDKYRNLRRTLNFTSHLNSQPSTSGEATSSSFEETDEIKRCKEWLKNYTDPWVLVVENWAKTYPIRNAHHACKTIHDFFEEWPILKHYNAYELIAYDFQESFKSDINKSLLSEYQKWDAFFTKCKNLYPLEKHCEQFIAPLSLPQIDQDSKHAIEISALPMLFPPKTRIRTGKRQWKPSTIEAVNSIITLASSSANIEECIENRIKEMKGLGLSVQPYLICVGASVSQVTDTYVVIDSHKYKVSSVLHGLDFTFKAFQALNAEYPKESAHIWILIERALYKIETTKTLNIPGVLTILQDLGC